MRISRSKSGAPSVVDAVGASRAPCAFKVCGVGLRSIGRVEVWHADARKAEGAAPNVAHSAEPVRVRASLVDEAEGAIPTFWSRFGRVGLR